MMVCVDFEDSDYGRTMKMKVAVQNMAKFLCTNADNVSRYVRNFCMIMRDSSDWCIDNYDEKLTLYFKQITARRIKCPNDKSYFENVKKIFSVCTSEKDICYMRGLMTEYIVVEANNKNLTRDWSMKQGCKVKINGILVSTKANGDGKETVDIGAWCFNKQCGFFVESKTQPYSFAQKDADYLMTLRGELQKYADIRYKICLFSLDAEGLMRRKAEQDGYTFLNDTIILDERSVFNTDLFIEAEK